MTAGIPFSLLLIQVSHQTLKYRAEAKRFKSYLRSEKVGDRPKHRRSASAQTWKTFLHNHAKELVAIDFFTVPTATFRVLYVFLVLAHERRKVLHFHITEAPSAAWTAQQMVEAFAFTSPPRYLLRESGWHLWRGFRAPSRGLGLGTKAHRPSIALAESDGRTPHWLDPPRKFRPRDYLQWPRSASPQSFRLSEKRAGRSLEAIL